MVKIHNFKGFFSFGISGNIHCRTLLIFFGIRGLVIFNRPQKAPFSLVNLNYLFVKRIRVQLTSYPDPTV